MKNEKRKTIVCSCIGNFHGGNFFNFDFNQESLWGNLKIDHILSLSIRHCFIVLQINVTLSIKKNSSRATLVITITMHEQTGNINYKYVDASWTDGGNRGLLD